jgi:CRISPR-associated endonuclease Cas1 subtype II
MGWRTVVVSKPSKLDLRLGYMVVRDCESNIRVHISEISVLIIENTASSITTALLNELTKQKIKVIFCDEKQNPSSELVSYYGCHDSSLKFRSQLEWSDINKQTVWTAIVTQKIKMQAQNLEFFHLDEADMLYDYIDEIEFNDESNREGHAAKVYFNAMFGKKFSRSDECPINAMLNYGYSIILSCFNREIVCNGYSTMLGLFHNNMFNSFNFGCDIMEPFRPIVDRAVKNINPQKFETEEKRLVLSLLSMELCIDGKNQTLLNTMKIYAKSVFDAIESGDTAEIKFYRYEL